MSHAETTNLRNRERATFEGRRRRRLRPLLQSLENRRLLATFTVVNTLDDGGNGSLRWAIGQANSSTGTDTINFDPTVFNTLKTITLGGTELVLSDTTGVTTITGPTTGVTVNGGGLSRVFKVNASVIASISGLTISGGVTTVNGGGLANYGSITLTNCTVSGNKAKSGGGLFQYGASADQTLTDCVVSGNTATGAGGGMYSGQILNGGKSGGTTTLIGSSVSGNTAATQGGGLALVGTNTLTNSTISGNSGVSAGGMFSNYGTTALTNCTVSGNFARTAGGGGMFQQLGTVTLKNSTFSNNSAGLSGGGLVTNGTTTLTNCTFTGNLSSADGGGINTISTLYPMTLTNCTLSGNSAQGKGGGLSNGNGTMNIANTIVAGNTASTSGPDANGPVASKGNNLIGVTNGSSGWVGTDLSGTTAAPLNPGLGPLANYGGLTNTMSLEFGSPAIDAGSNVLATGITTDQRGANRIYNSNVDIGAYEVQSPLVAGFVVNTTIDFSDPFDGLTTLREAIESANTLSGTPVTFDPSVFSTAQTIRLSGIGLLLSNATGTERIIGPAAGVTIDAGGLSRVLQVLPGVVASVTGLTLTGGSIASVGGGLYNLGSTSLINCTITGNSARSGGGLYTSSGGATTLINCTVSGNTASQKGGGLYNAAGASSTLVNCTVSGNTATSGGGLYRAGGTISVRNTIVAGNAAGTGPDVFGTFASQGFNVVGKTNGGTGWVASDQTGTVAAPLDAKLSPLGSHGGPTRTMGLLPGSPAIGRGTAGAGIPTADQRGLVRGQSVDIGAFQTSLLVRSTSGSVDTNAATLTLPGAVALANQFAGSSILFDPTVFPTSKKITLAAQLELRNTTLATSITGPTAGVIVSGGRTTRVFQVNEGATANFSGFTIADGLTLGDGGGLYNAGGNTTLSDVTVAGNAASGRGGALFNSKRGTTTIINCSLNGNSATGDGGGLFNDDGVANLSNTTLRGNSATSGGGLLNAKRGTTTVINCSVNGNFASVSGGGLVNDEGVANLTNTTVGGNSAPTGGGLLNAKRGTTTIINCSLSDNTGAVGAGIANEGGGGATLQNTIVAANRTSGGAPSDIGGDSAAAVVGTYSLVGTGGSGGLAGGTGVVVLTDLSRLGLAPLGNYGGSTQTIPLLPGSVALGAGTVIPGITTDQRGLPPSGATPDIGAFQSQGFILKTGVGSTPQATATGTAFPNPLTVIVKSINPLEPVAGGSVTFTVNPAGNGASAGLSAATVILGADGVGQVTATANSIAGGPYTVTASAAGDTLPVDFQLKNLIKVGFSGTSNQTITFGASSVTFAGVLGNGVVWPEGQNVIVTLDGVQQSANVGAGGVFSTTFNPSAVHASGSPYTISYQYLTDGSFASTATTSTLTVLKATPNVTWANPTRITYGTALSSTQLNATADWTVNGVNGAVDGSFNYTPALGTVLDAGMGQTLSVIFTPTDSIDYNTITQTVTIDVDKATPIINWATPARITYGTALSSTQLNATSAWTVGGVNGPVLGSFDYTPAAGSVLNAGLRVLAVAFTPADSKNYNNAGQTVTIDVDKATPILTWATPSPITYGTALSATQLSAAATWTVGGLNGPVVGSYNYTPAAGTILNAGSAQVLAVSFDPADSVNYNTIAAAVRINVLKATPDIIWAAPSDITYGTALSSTQLNATVNWTVGGVKGPVTGSLRYTPAAGTVLNAGAGQPLTVAFTPADSKNYNIAAKTVPINVDKAKLVIAWATPSDITYGTALSSTQLNATVEWTVDGLKGPVAGLFNYTPAAGTVLNAGQRTLAVDFTPTDSKNYVAATQTVPIFVEKALPIVTWDTPSRITYGTALSSTQLNAAVDWTVGGVNGPVLGSFDYTPAAGTVLNAGIRTLAVAFTPSDTKNYGTVTYTVPIVVDKASPIVTWATPSRITYGTALSSTQLNAAAAWNVGGLNGPVAGSYRYIPAAGTVLNAGAGQTLAVFFAPTDSANYDTISSSVKINVDKATPDITWALPSNITYGTALSSTQLNAAAKWTVGGANGPVLGTLDYTPALGSVLNAGPRTLAVAFTPADSKNYNSTGRTVPINVDKATPNITWDTPSNITFGTALSSTQLNAAVNWTVGALNGPVAGSLSYTPAEGTVLDSGRHPLTVAFTPTDSINYDVAFHTVSIEVELDHLGTIQFSNSVYLVPERAGFARITVNRVNGARGTLTVHYATTSINATPGLDFTPVSGTLTFPDGVRSRTIEVPVLANPYDNTDELVRIELSDVQTTETIGEPFLGTPAAATLTIQDIDPNYNPLIVSDVQWTGTAKSIAQVLVSYSKPVISSAAINPANYVLVDVGPDGKYGSLDDSPVLMSVEPYQSSSMTVALTPVHPLPANRFFHLEINGAAPGGIQYLGHAMLAGDGQTPGTNYTAMLARGTNLTYYTPAGDRANLRITGGGIIDDLLNGSGQGVKLSLVGRVPRRTVLSGTLKKAWSGSGTTYLGYTIWGLGRFGDVRLKLVWPTFQISQLPYSPGSAASKAPAPLIPPISAKVGSTSSNVVTTKPPSRGESVKTLRGMNRPFHSFLR